MNCEDRLIPFKEKFEMIKLTHKLLNHEVIYLEYTRSEYSQSQTIDLTIDDYFRCIITCRNDGVFNIGIATKIYEINKYLLAIAYHYSKPSKEINIKRLEKTFTGNFINHDDLILEIIDEVFARL